MTNILRRFATAFVSAAVVRPYKRQRNRYYRIADEYEAKHGYRSFVSKKTDKKKDLVLVVKIKFRGGVIPTLLVGKSIRVDIHGWDTGPGDAIPVIDITPVGPA